MKNQNIEAVIKKTLILLVALSILFVLGIPGIVIGFSVKNLTALGIFSIVVVAAGFYGLPLGWVSFGVLHSLKAIVYNVQENGILEISALARAIGKKDKETLPLVRKVLNKRYLTGYTFSPDNTSLVKIEKPEEPIPEPVVTETTTKGRCIACGAPLPPDSNGICPYCGMAN
ncbi:MAG: zinc ribbon domain-containing protein [Clostridiales bacterium]|jgi:hypothetical protein|nr:zinc ribbon domain-containing protein [Clostridiales bacterium]